ncbi:MAG TPA: O-methyltransferase [Bacteroidia bacterium]|nr:O-methyltransferase [Bacteroidia bacterium]
MDFLDEKLTNYIEKHTGAEPFLLSELNRETYAKIIMPRMLSGHLQGRVLAMLSHMIKPENVLEIGTYTGYSALCFAEGLREGGKIITIDINEELEDMVADYIRKAGYENKIEQLIGDATKIIPELNTKFDLVFIDADKENYCNYYDLVFDKVNKGGYIIADNVLWSGNILKNRKDMDEETTAIDDYNKKIYNDNRVEKVIFPIRDGLMIARKL